MGRGSDLWDDSALVHAFDHAIATYKVMHGENSGNILNDGKDKIVEDETACAETWSPKHADDDKDEWKEASDAEVTNFKKTSTSRDFPIGEDHINPTLSTIASEPNFYSVPATAVITDNHPGQPSVDYDQLLKQYYELEEQKQKIVEQLQQANYWTHQTSQYGEYEPQQVPANSTSGNCMYPSCSLCSPYCLTPLIPGSGCATGGMSFGGNYCCPISCSLSHGYPVVPEIHSTHVDDEVSKIGKRCAEMALNLTSEGPSASNGSEEKEEKDEQCSGDHADKVLESTHQDTDLAVVLSAWYSAGFHTGRYLSEQAWKKA